MVPGFSFELQNPWFSCCRHLFRVSGSCTAVPFPLRYRALRAPGAGLRYLEQVKLLLESARSVAGSCAPAAQRKGTEHLGPLPTAAEGRLRFLLPSDHGERRRGPRGVINDAVRQQRNKLKGMRLPFALGNNIKYLSASCKTREGCWKRRFCNCRALRRQHLEKIAH